MAFPVRLRHPKGVTTISVDPNGKVSDLQQTVFSSTEIPPSLQEFKSGYPPRSLTLIPDLPIESLGIQRGDQLIVSAASGSNSGGSKAPASGPPQPLRSSQSSSNVAPSVSAPAFQPRVAPRQELSADGSVQIQGGSLVHRVVPDDNSCLFSSIGIVFEQDMNVTPKLRKVVVEAIRKDPITWSDAVLGQPQEDYIKTISKPSSWGGAIELSIFSEHYRTEISSFDIETGRCDRFGEGKWDNRAILLYSGIHYDAVSLSPTPSAPVDFHETVFPASSQAIMAGAAALAAQLRAKKAYTNTATFDLKCEICGKGLKGEKEARQHATESGHAQFGEY